MTDPIRIDVGICTFRRPQLEQTLRSLGRLHVPAGVVLQVIVADNDSAPSARALVHGMAADLPFEIRYVHCPASNISLVMSRICLGVQTAAVSGSRKRAWIAASFERSIHAVAARSK